MAWLTRGDEVLASLESGRGHRPDEASGVVVLRRRPLLVRGPLRGCVDVAWCRPGPDGDVEVRRMVCLGPRMPVVPGWGSPVVVVASGGAFERWRLRVGDRLTVRGD